MNNEEESYQMTPKGWLVLALGGNLTQADKIWDGLKEFVARRAKADGMDGIPCLILKDGGHCVTLEEVNRPAHE